MFKLLKKAVITAGLMGVWSISCPMAQGEVMLQWFETEWDDMYRRMPQVAEIGYDYIWTPPPK